ncbi:MAG: hypothetical protein ABR562_08600, partial [Thermoplasmatota archaeon]
AHSGLDWVTFSTKATQTLRRTIPFDRACWHTVDPGTVVRFHKQPDHLQDAWIPQADGYVQDHNDPTGHVGYRESHVQVYGRIVAVGTKEAPILFTSAEAHPEYADWNQLVLASGSRLENVTAEYMHNGINVNGDHVVLRNIVARESLWSCIDSFGDDITMRDIEAYHCWHQAVGYKGTGQNTLDGAYLHDSQVAVNCEEGTQPTLAHIRTKAAFMAPSCGTPDLVEEPGNSDVPGGTYDGVLIYPGHG